MHEGAAGETLDRILLDELRRRLGDICVDGSADHARYTSLLAEVEEVRRRASSLGEEAWNEVLASALAAEISLADQAGLLVEVLEKSGRFREVFGPEPHHYSNVMRARMDALHRTDQHAEEASAAFELVSAPEVGIFEVFSALAWFSSVHPGDLDRSLPLRDALERALSRGDFSMADGFAPPPWPPDGRIEEYVASVSLKIRRWNQEQAQRALEHYRRTRNE